MPISQSLRWQNERIQTPGYISITAHSTAELAKIISYKSQTIRKWLCQDKLPEGLPRPKQINGRHYWLRKDVLDFIDTFSVRESL